MLAYIKIDLKGGFTIWEYIMIFLPPILLL